MIRKLAALGALLLLCACGGGGGGGASSSGGSGSGGGGGGSTTLNNYTTVTVNAGPAALDEGADAYTSLNVGFVSVTLCAPGSTTNCQTIPYVEVDTGSVGLRIFASAMSSSLLSALPNETDPGGNPVGECYAYVDGYVFGSVRNANFQIGGEQVSSMPLQVIADSGVFSSPPTSCSSGGGPNLNTIQSFGANGVIGIGVTGTDCGSACAVSGGEAAAIYYDCPASGCSTIIARSAATTAPFQQVVNPVSAMSVDNNGTVMTFASVSSPGAATATGTLYFGIGTETNNGLGSATVYTTTASTSPFGAGLLTVAFNGQNLADSFIDSGSNLYYFVDSSIATCTETGFTGLYCPSSPDSLSLTVEGQNGASGSAGFTLYNAYTALSGANASNAAAPGLGANPDAISGFEPYPSSFDLGLPFFYGRSVFTAIEGTTAAGTPGPYVAF
jgi:hypothetical protein